MYALEGLEACTRAFSAHVYNLPPDETAFVEKNTIRLNYGSLRMASVRFASSETPANASSPPSEPESESSNLASGSAASRLASGVAVESLGTSEARVCFSIPIYIYGTRVKRLEYEVHFIAVYVGYDDPHALHALCSCWPCTITFEVLASHEEAIYRCHIPIP